MNKYLIFAILAGIAFGVWPNIASKAKISVGTLVIINGLGFLVLGIIMKISSGEITNPIPSFDILKYVLLGCAINASGYIFYGPVVMATQKLGTTTFIVVAMVSMVMATYLYGVIFLKTPINYVKVSGIILVIIGIILIKK